MLSINVRVAYHLDVLIVDINISDKNLEDLEPLINISSLAKNTKNQKVDFISERLPATFLHYNVAYLILIKIYHTVS